MQTPIIKDEKIGQIAEKYGLSTINANDATHYKFCQIIVMLETQLAEVRPKSNS